VHDINFDDQLPWAEFAGGEGYSLVAIPSKYALMAANSRTHKDKNSVKYWRYSSKIDGSPWKDDPEPSPSRNIALQVAYNYIDFLKNVIEFSNPTNKPVDISGWVLMIHQSGKWKDEKISAKTVIPAGGKLTYVVNRLVLEDEQHLYLFNYDPLTNKYPGDFNEFVRSDWELAI